MAQSELKFVAVCVFMMYALHCNVAAVAPQCPPGTIPVTNFLICMSSVPGSKAACAPHPGYNVLGVWGIGHYGGASVLNDRISLTLDAVPTLHNGCASITRTNPPVATLPDSKNVCHAQSIVCVENADRNAAPGDTSDSSESR